MIGACFCDFSEFQEWKESLEDSENCLFIKNTGDKRKWNTLTVTGGDYVPKGTEKKIKKPR